MAALKEPGERHQRHQRKSQRLQQGLRRKDKALAEAAAPLITANYSSPTGERTSGMVRGRESPQGSGDPRCRRRYRGVGPGAGRSAGHGLTSL